MRRGSWIAAGVAGVLVVGAAAGWMWVGNNPAVQPGNFGGPVTGVTVTTDKEFGSTTWVMSGNTAVIRESIRNDGSFPFTLAGIVSPADVPVTLSALFQSNTFQGVDDPPLPPASEETVTVRPGSVVGIDITVTVPPCSKRVAGPLQLGGAEFVVRSAGIATTQVVTFAVTEPLRIPGLNTHGECVETITG